MLVLALLLLLTTLVITGDRAIAQATGEGDATAAVQSAIAGARRAAVTTGQAVVLHAAPDAFSWDGGGTQAIPPGDTKVFLLPARTDALSLIGGEAVEKPITDVHFFPDGTCDAFRIEYKRGSATTILEVDPWTSSILRSSDDPKS